LASIALNQNQSDSSDSKEKSSSSPASPSSSLASWAGRQTEYTGINPLICPKGHRFVWTCHDCHEGVVVPATYLNSYGEEVKIDAKNLDADIEVIRF
jgi:hypothetical protein